MAEPSYKLSEIGTLEEIGRRIGVAGLRATKKRHPDRFPAPVGKVGNCPIYVEAQIRQFYGLHVRPKARNTTATAPGVVVLAPPPADTYPRRLDIPTIG